MNAVVPAGEETELLVGVHNEGIFFLFSLFLVSDALNLLIIITSSSCSWHSFGLSFFKSILYINVDFTIAK